MQEIEKRERRDTMKKEEFEDLVGQALSDRDYEIIETVYLYHPAIRDVSGKEEVAELYKCFGMVIFYDMFRRAKRNQDLESQLHHTQAEADRIKEEMVQNRASMGLDYSRMLEKLADEASHPSQSGTNQKTNEVAKTARRLQSYAEALLGCGNGDVKSDDVQSNYGADPQGVILIMRKGDAVSYNCTCPDGHIEIGCYRRETSVRPSLVKCYIDNGNGYIEFGRTRYFSSKLTTRHGEYVQAARIGDTLYIFDMCGKCIEEIKCHKQ